VALVTLKAVSLVEVIAAERVVEVKVACAQEVETAKSSEATKTKSCLIFDI